MPMPPMPTKWIGPMSRGSFMQSGPFSFQSGDPHHQIGEPVGRVDDADRPGGRRHGGEPVRLGREAGDLGGEPLGRERRLLDPHRAARLRQHAGIGHLVLVERMRQRHQMAGRPMAASSATVEAPERETTRWLAAMRAGRSWKNGATSAPTPSRA